MKEEFVDIVDENDKCIGKVARKEAHENVLRMRVSRVLIFNGKNEILLQKRAQIKLRYPDHWDFGVAETVHSGEDYDSAAVRGLREELNITGFSNSDIKYLFKLKYTAEKTKRWYKVYYLMYNGPLKVNNSEVSETRLVSEDVLNRMLETEKFIPVGLAVYREYERTKR